MKSKIEEHRSACVENFVRNEDKEGGMLVFRNLGSRSAPGFFENIYYINELILYNLPYILEESIKRVNLPWIKIKEI